MKVRLRLPIAAAVAIAAAVLAVTSVAMSAASKPKLSFVKGGGASIGWATDVGSSPGGGVSNANDQSLRIDAPTAGGGASAYTYGSSEDLVGIRGKTLLGIDRLGFDSKGYLGAGAPRISLGTVTVTSDGVHSAGEQHTFFLSAYYCNDATSGGWRTSDFADTALSPGTSTGGASPDGIRPQGCYVFDQNGVAYGPDGLESAAAAYPNDVVQSTPNDWFLIVDEAPSLTYVDRLTVENWMWTGNGTNGIINCNSGGCI